jgi:hypothetical protein
VVVDIGLEKQRVLGLGANQHVEVEILLLRGDLPA